MRHHRKGKKLGRDSAHRKALYSNLAGALIEHGRIKTTVAKAKAVRPITEQMITLGRRGDLAARRQALAYLRSNDVVTMLFSDVAPRFIDRPGGYTRIVKLGPRFGDSAEMAYLELVDFVPPAPKPKRVRQPEPEELEEAPAGGSGRYRLEPRLEHDEHGRRDVVRVRFDRDLGVGRGQVAQAARELVGVLFRGDVHGQVAPAPVHAQALAL